MQVEYYKFEVETVESNGEYLDTFSVNHQITGFNSYQQGVQRECLPVREVVSYTIFHHTEQNRISRYTAEMSKKGFALDGKPVNRQGGLEYRFIKRYVLDNAIQEHLIDPQLDSVKSECARQVSNLQVLVDKSNQELSNIKSLSWWKRLFKVGYYDC